MMMPWPSPNRVPSGRTAAQYVPVSVSSRSEEHTSELQSPSNLVCRLLLEKKKNKELLGVQDLYLAFITDFYDKCYTVLPCIVVMMRTVPADSTPVFLLSTWSSSLCVTFV